MLGERLKNLRKNKNITQEDLAGILNISQGTIGNWETGNREPGSEMLIKIADYFATTVDYLIGRTEKGIDPEDSARSHFKPFNRIEFDGLLQSEIETLAAVAQTLKAQRINHAKETKRVFKAAHSKGNAAPGYTEIHKADMEKLKNATPVKSADDL